MEDFIEKEAEKLGGYFIIDEWHFGTLKKAVDFAIFVLSSKYSCEPIIQRVDILLGINP
jgi:hypothetical protein